MSNIFYADGVTYKDTQGTAYGRLINELVQQVAPRRPGLSFVFKEPSRCYVYNGTPDITCEDNRTVKYVGCIYSGYGSRRGGKGWRASVKLDPAGENGIETVSMPTAVKTFLKEFTVRSYEEALEGFANTARKVVSRMRHDSRHNITAHVGKLLSDMSDLDLSTQCRDILNGTSTPDAWKVDMPEEYMENLRHTTMFGSKFEKLVCVMPVGDLYVAKHGDSLTEYTHESLPLHMSRSIGMLKLVGVDNQLMAGYGIPIPGGAYAISSEEVEV